MLSPIRKNLLGLAPLAVIVLYCTMLALKQAYLVRLLSGLLVLTCLLTSLCVVIYVLWFRDSDDFPTRRDDSVRYQ